MKFNLLILMLGCWIVTPLLSQTDSTKPCLTVTRTVKNAKISTTNVWDDMAFVFGYLMRDGTASPWTLEAGGTFKETGDGKAELNATIRQFTGLTPPRRLRVSLKFSGRTFKTPSTGGFNALRVPTSGWYYYPTISGTLTGLEALSGGILTLQQHGTQFQMGVGANFFDAALMGGGGGLRWTVTAQPNSSLRFNPFVVGQSSGTMILSLSGSATPRCKDGGSICDRDTIPPTIVCPKNIEVCIIQADSGLARWQPPVVTDNCQVESITSNFKTETRFPVGMTQVNFTARDKAGNTSTCSFNIKVTRKTCDELSKLRVRLNTVCKGDKTCVDPNNPFTTLDSLTDVIISCRDAEPEYDFSTFKFAANVVSAVSIIPPTTRQGFDTICFTEPRFVRVKINVDGCKGILIVDTVLINICNPQLCALDTVRPENIRCPTNITTTTTGTCAVVMWATPIWSDNCTTPFISQVSSPTSNLKQGSCFPLGTTNVTYTARDLRNNSTTCSFNVSVNFIETCQNITNAGTIGNITATSCPPAPIQIIQSVTLPTGGSGTLEYVWESALDNADFPSFSRIPNATSATYQPSSQNVTTLYRRLARSSGCVNYLPSNTVRRVIFCSDNFLSTNQPSITLFAQQILREVHLQWANKNGLAIDFYRVQKMDEQGIFKTIETLNVDKTQIDYLTAIDTRPNEGENWYRIESVDNNGKIVRSNLEKIDYKEMTLLRLFPNPANADIFLEIENLHERAMTFSISNTMGQTLVRETFIVKKGKQLIKLNVEAVPNGVYFVTLPRNAYRHMPIKFVKM